MRIAIAAPFALLATCFWCAGRAGAADKTNPFLRAYDANGQAVEAGFVPYKTEVVLGEPLYVTFTVRNKSDRAFPLVFGGDYRATGRHDRFTVTATDAAGAAVPDPQAKRLAEGALIGGGITGMRVVPPGGDSTERVDLPKFRSLDKPGVYEVTCAFTLEDTLAGDGKGKVKLPVKTSFTLTIHPATPERVRPLVAELGREVEAKRHAVSADVVATLCAFGDESVVGPLLSLLGGGSRDARTASMAALARFDREEVTAALLGAARDKEPSIRAAAANALGAHASLPGARAKALGALLAAVTDPQPPVRAAACAALAAAKAPEAFDPLVAALDDADRTVARAAAVALGTLGDRRAVAPLRRATAEAKLDRRLDVVWALMTLGEPLNVEWVTPLIRAGGHHPRHDGLWDWQGVVWLVRRHGGQEAAPALAGCLDFDDPSANNYRNYTLVWQIHACGGPKLTYHHDFDNPGTPEQLRDNAATLASLKEFHRDAQSRKPA